MSPSLTVVWKRQMCQAAVYYSVGLFNFGSLASVGSYPSQCFVSLKDATEL